MARKYTPSQCIVTFIVLSTLMTIVGCIASAIVLLLAPQEPVVWVYNGGDYTFYPSIGLLIAAFAALMISFVGCCGALRDSKAALIMFSLCSCVVIGLYLASSTSIFVFANSDKISNGLNTTLVNKLVEYNGGNNKTDFGTLQESIACCGVINYTDWQEYNTAWRRNESVLAPQSCCKEQFRDIDNCTENASDLYTEGCLEVILFRLRPVVDAVFALSIVIAAVQGITGSMSCYGSYLIWKYEQYDIL